MGCELNCPILYTQNILKGKWSILIIYRIDELNGSRFLELKASLYNITSTTLTNQLSSLIENGIVEKIDNNSYPRVVKYILTQKGIELKEMIQLFETWGNKYM